MAIADVGESVFPELALVAADCLEVSALVGLLPVLAQQSLLSLIYLDIDQRQSIFSRPLLLLRLVADSFADIVIDSTSSIAY